MAAFILFTDLQFGQGIVAMVISVPLGINLGGSKTGLKSSEDTFTPGSWPEHLHMALGKACLSNDMVAGF